MRFFLSVMLVCMAIPREPDLGLGRPNLIPQTAALNHFRETVYLALERERGELRAHDGSTIVRLLAPRAQ